jgi:hypothetical protein
MLSRFEVKTLLIQDYRSCVSELQHELEPLEAGWMRTGERDTDGVPVDTTARDIERLKSCIAEYERCVAVIEQQWAENSD